MKELGEDVDKERQWDIKFEGARIALSGFPAPGYFCFFIQFQLKCATLPSFLRRSSGSRIAKAPMQVIE